MPVTVEFFGIPRERAKASRTTAVGDTLGAVLADLAGRFPVFATECLTAEGRLRPECIANVGDLRFTRDPDTPVTDGDSVLVLSADVGG